MEDDLDTALNPQSYNTVDPEVRAYVYSLVSAVQPTLHGTRPTIANVSRYSLVELALMKMVVTYLAMMLWHVWRTSRNGSNFTTRNPIGWTLLVVLQRPTWSMAICWKYWQPGQKRQQTIGLRVRYRWPVWSFWCHWHGQSRSLKRRWPSIITAMCPICSLRRQDINVQFFSMMPWYFEQQSALYSLRWRYCRVNDQRGMGVSSSFCSTFSGTSLLSVHPRTCQLKGARARSRDPRQ